MPLFFGAIFFWGYNLLITCYNLGGRSPIFSIRGAVAVAVAVAEEGLAQLKPGEPLRGTPPVTSVGSPLCGLPDGWEVSANDTATMLYKHDQNQRDHDL
jgi:hypothetical protein